MNSESLAALRSEIYAAETHMPALQRYMKRGAPANNSSAKILRLAEYDGTKGDLFLVLDREDEIRAISSVIREETRLGPAAKIYGRLHIEPGIPHAIIDRFFEPMTFEWCLKRGIQRLFLTVNEGNLRILDWVSRRMGDRRAAQRPNEYAPGLGAQFRSGFMPLNRLIFERHCWQYVIFCDPNRQWFLERDSKPLETEAARIFKREFSVATQNWP